MAKTTIANEGNISRETIISTLLTKLQIGGWLLLLDLALLLAATLLICTHAKIFLFHIVYILLTFGAFFWQFRAFAIRAIFWVAVTTTAVGLAVFAHEIPSEEIVEIPLLTSMLILVYSIAQQRSNTQKALQRSEERYHTLFDNLFKESRDAIFVADKEKNIIDVNRTLLDLFDSTRDEIIGLDYEKSYIQPRMRGKFRQEMDQNGFVRDHEVTLRKTDGTEIYCLLNSSTWQANDGSINGYQGIIRDISARMQAIAALRESEERYRRLVELSFEGIMVHAQGRFLYLNAPARKILGAANPQEVIGQSVLDFVHPDYLEIVKERIHRASQAGEGSPLVEEKFIRVDGTSVDVEVAAVPITYQGQPAVQAVVRDITLRKQAEAEREHLLTTEREQRLLAETLGDVFLALTAQTSYQTVLDEILQQARRLVSYSAANIVLLKEGRLRIARHKGYHNFESRTLVANLEQALSNFPLDAEVVRSQRPIVIPDTNKDRLWVSVSESAWVRSFIAVPICLRNQVLGLLRLDSETLNKFSGEDVKRLQPLAHAAAIALENAQLYDRARQEIAERVEIEQELRKVAAKNQAILDAIPDSIFQFDREGRLLDYKISEGSSTLSLLSTPPVGMKLNDIPRISPDLVELFMDYIGKTLDTRTIQIFEYQLQLPQDTHDFEVWLVWSERDEVLAIVRDVTERKARAAALEKERARIARDLHDSLGQNLGYLRLKLEEFLMDDTLPRPGTLRPKLRQMRDVADEAYQLVRNMLAAARPTNSADLAEVLLAQAKAVSRRAHFKVDLSSKGQVHRLSPLVQQQVLFIFKEALSNIEKHARSQQVDIQMIWTENMLLIKLRDDGCGFEMNVPRGDGHYGLIIMQERAGEIGGTLSISSIPGVGTELILQLHVASINKPAILSTPAVNAAGE